MKHAIKPFMNSIITSTFKDFIDVLDARKSFTVTEITDKGTEIKHFNGEFTEVYKIIEAIEKDRSYKEYIVIGFETGLINAIWIYRETPNY